MDDPFSMLGLPRRFDLDAGDVERAYLARAAALHPDLAGGGDPTRDSALLNDARRTLLDPEARARTLVGGQTGKDLPDGFLEQVMMTRMEVEAELAEGGPAARARWQDWADERRAERLGRLSELLGAGEPSPEACARARVELNALRYVERLIEQLEPA